MNGAQLHLLVNHIPVFLPVVGGLILVYGLVRRSEEILRLALGMLLIAALTSLLAYFSGRPAERIVKNYPEINRAAIETHESLALVAIIVVEVVGLAALGLLVLSQRRRIARRWFILVAVSAFVAFAIVAWTAHIGGLIRHEELDSRTNGSARF